MSKDDLYIAVCVLDSDVLINTFSPTGTVECHDLQDAGRYWRVEDKNVYTVEDWVYYDPMEWGVNKACSLYGVSDLIKKTKAEGIVEILDWTAEVIDGFDIQWAIRDADEYESTVKELERLK